MCRGGFLTTQFSSVTQSCPTLCYPMGCSMLGFPACRNSCSLLKLMSIKAVMPSNPLILCHPLLLPFPASGSFPMSQFLASGGQSIGVSSSASVFPNNYSGLISLRIDWLDLLAVQGTLKSLLQHHSSKASILWCSAFVIVQFSQRKAMPKSVQTTAQSHSSHMLAK